jgi:hypothetical protein
VDAHESSLGPGGEDRHEGHPEDPRESADPIMANLPRSRPQRDEPRARAEARRKPPSSDPGSRARTAASRKAAVRASSEPAEPAEGDPAPLGPTEHAPGLPRLALDGAIEAAKLPVKVGANITFRALDAVTKSLRGR